MIPMNIDEAFVTHSFLVWLCCVGGCLLALIAWRLDDNVVLLRWLQGSGHKMWYLVNMMKYTKEFTLIQASKHPSIRSRGRYISYNQTSLCRLPCSTR